MEETGRVACRDQASALDYHSALLFFSSLQATRALKDQLQIKLTGIAARRDECFIISATPRKRRSSGASC
jgi:hypothetical protein